MSIQSSIENWQNYLHEIQPDTHPVLLRISNENQQSRLGKMSIDPVQMNCLLWLAALINVKHYLEIGVFTGYSSTAMALALPNDGTITACDINVTFTDKARQAWNDANIAHKINLHLQPALFTLKQLLADGKKEFYDMVFIDADKIATKHYVETCLELTRHGGIIAIDNVFLGGRVWHPPHPKEPLSVNILRNFNRQIVHDKRVRCMNLPLGDGLMILQKI